MRCLLLYLLLCSATFSFAEQDSLRGVQTDIMLHPCDGFTAYTLKKNEFIYNQSPFTFPLPSWAWWGITDKITAEIDLLPLIGGFFQPPHLPVPSLNFRFLLYQKQRWTIAFETMFQHLWVDQNQSDFPNPRVERNAGNSWFNRFNFSWYNDQRLRFHFSAGATYSENLLIESTDSTSYHGRYFNRTFNPDISAAVDWRPKPWISMHFTASYGTTFVYLDNIPRKYQLTYGFRLAPLINRKWGIFRCFRIELAGFYMHLPDARQSMYSLLPIFPYFYWQWTLPGKKGRN